METKEMEKQVIERCHQQNWAFDPNKDLRSVMEEVGELAREIRRVEDGRERPDETEPAREAIIQEMASEVGDILFALVKLAHQYGFTLEEAFTCHQQKLNERYNEKE